MSGDDRSTIEDWIHLPPAELVASVSVAPAPQIPLASIRSLLSPVRDEGGDLVDWTIDLTGVIEHDPVERLVSEYHAWRRTWRHGWPIGPVSNVASLLEESAAIERDGDRPVDDLLELVVAADGAEIAVDADMAEPLLDDLETIRLALSVDERTGCGLVDDMPALTRSAGLARTWAPPRAEQVLAATPMTAVLLRPGEGLVLVHGEHDPATTLSGVSAVDMCTDTVLVMNDRGATVRLTQADARPLGWLVPRSLRWHVREVPLVVVWAVLFDGLASALRAGAERGVAVHIDSQSLLGHGAPAADLPPT